MKGQIEPKESIFRHSNEEKLINEINSKENNFKNVNDYKSLILSRVFINNLDFIDENEADFMKSFDTKLLLIKKKISRYLNSDNFYELDERLQNGILF